MSSILAISCCCSAWFLTFCVSLLWDILYWLYIAQLLCTGCNKDYLNRTYLLYDGVHYDPLVFKQSDGRLKYKFSADDDQYTLLALNVAKEAHKVPIASIHFTVVSMCVCTNLTRQTVMQPQVEEQSGHMSQVSVARRPESWLHQLNCCIANYVGGN